MNDLKEQPDTIETSNEASNNEIANASKILRLLCDTSSVAYLFYNYADNTVQTIANWDYFFDCKVESNEELSKLYNYVEIKYITPLKDALFVEKRGMKSAAIDFKMKDSRMWVEIETNVIYDEQGRPQDKVIRLTDVTKFNMQNDELNYVTYYDTLTGLYNRNYFIHLLGEFLCRSDYKDKSVAVMFLDLDDFRKLCDDIGIFEGDECLKLFGQLLSELADENILISHFNADVFCIGIYDPCGERSVDAIYKKIYDKLKNPFVLTSGKKISLTVSVGVAEYPIAASNTLELINCAEIVMFKAKIERRGGIKYFERSILDEFLKSVSIENKLKEAVFSQNFVMYFQPQFKSADNKLRGVEALIRWRENSEKLIRPDVFIPIAEKNGAIVPIGSWVIEESIKIYSDWKKKYNYPMLVSLNVSAIQYRQPDFIENVLGILNKYNVSPEEVELEITESVLIDDFKEITDKLAALRDIGIKISLDDFGTGYSSLSYLKGLPIDTLKIDKSFIDTVITDENSRIITETIVYMIKKLGLESIAEGVETKEQYDYLKSIECDNIQGFYLGRPMPPEELEKVIEKSLA